MAIKITYYSQKVDGKLSINNINQRRRDYFIESLKDGCVEHTIRRAVKPKSHNQVKMIFGHMIESTIAQADECSIGVEDMLVYLIDGNIPKGIAINKDFLHALMYTICPTVDDEGQRVTLSKMSTKQANDLFERFRNIMAPLGIVISDPSKDKKGE